MSRQNFDPIQKHIKELESRAKAEDIIYFNLTMGVGQRGSESVNAQISAASNTPIIAHPDEYYCSIVRLEVPLLNIPIGYAHVIEPVLDVNNTVYSFSLSYNNRATVITKNVQWITPSIGYPPPPTGTATQTKSQYYFIQSYQQFIDLWNTALSNAFTDLATAIPAVASAGAPFFYYNASNSSIELYGNSTYYDLNVVSPISIYFNGDLIPYLNGFSYTGVGGIYPLPNNLLLLKSNPSVTIPLNNVMIGMVNYTTIVQEFTNAQCYWNSLRQVVLTTSMNIVQESSFSSASSSLLSTGQNLQQLSVLTDFYPDTTEVAGSCRSTFIYNATALWRLFQFNQKSALYNVSVSIYWIDQDGEVWPLTIFPGISPSVKFMFIRKSLIDLSQNGNLGRL